MRKKKAGFSKKNIPAFFLIFVMRKRIKYLDIVQLFLLVAFILFFQTNDSV